MAAGGLALIVGLVSGAAPPAVVRHAPAPGAAPPAPSAATAAAAGAAVGTAERALLRTVFGIDDPARLVPSGPGPDGVMLYRAYTPRCAAALRRAAARGDSAAPRRPGCEPVLVRVGLTSPRRPGETWDAFAGRVARQGPRAWPAGATSYYTGLASLDPRARPAFERLVGDARRAGFRVRVAETYRSPERQTFLLARGGGRTETATSVHSYGRAADLIVGDGRIERPATAREWVRFRRWVLRYGRGAFRLVGAPERTWDWPHVELATPLLGYRSAQALVAAARACVAATSTAADAAARCTIAPRLPPHVATRAAD